MTETLPMDYALPAYRLYAQIPDMKHSNTLPDAGFDYRPMQVTNDGLTLPVRCLSVADARAEQRETRAGLVYRLRAQCTCGQEVPTGKLWQHWRGKAHKGTE